MRRTTLHMKISMGRMFESLRSTCRGAVVAPVRACPPPLLYCQRLQPSSCSSSAPSAKPPPPYLALASGQVGQAQCVAQLILAGGAGDVDLWGAGVDQDGGDARAHCAAVAAAAGAAGGRCVGDARAPQVQRTLLPRTRKGTSDSPSSLSSASSSACSEPGGRW